MDFEKLFNNVIAEAIADKKELIPTHELPSAKIIVENYNTLLDALQQMVNALDCGLRTEEGSINHKRASEAIAKAKGE